MRHARLPLFAAALLAPMASGQAPPSQPATTPAPPQVVNVDALPPAARLGVRSALLREQIPVVPVVVIVPDARSYLEAVARWTPKARFPVLIEDGSVPSTEDIARFVRGFAPVSVVRWSYKPEGGEAWPKDAAARRTLVEGSLARAWELKAGATQAEMIERWKAMGVVPPGIVIANIDDAAWPAGLALSAGHAEPLAWVSCKQSVGGTLTPQEGDALVASVEAAAEATGLKWRALGDDLDAVALCLNSPAKILLTPGQPLGLGPGVSKSDDVCATTDRVGRQGGSKTGRWGWASQIFGAERQAAYSAMCALFLSIERAWLFDGFPDGKPWVEWDCTAAAKELERLGIKTTVDDLPRGGRADWRARTSTPLDADLALINTRGECWFFDLAPGQGRPGDTPLLLRPAIVHMVHSWSMQYPNERGTVGGRWIIAGAYAYFGSVEEPYLGAFLQTPLVAARLGSGFAWGAACRNEMLPLWRLACIGDPLIARGPRPARLEAAALPLEGAVYVRDQVAEAVKAAGASGGKGDVFGRPLRMLTMLGEDAKVAEFAAALARDTPAQFTLDVAVASMYSLARAGRHDMLGKAFAMLDEPTARDANLRDALWIGSIGALTTTQDRELLKQLRRTLRTEQPERDAADLAPAYARVFGKPAALEMLQEVRAGMKDAKRAGDLDAMIGAMGGK